MKKMRKATAGERVVMDQYGCTVLGVRESSNFGPIARRIDALIRRAVREAWKARGEYSKAIASDTAGWDDISVIRERIERKYGVKL